MIYIKLTILFLGISVALVLQDVIVFQYACNCNFDGPTIDYYGFPFIYRNNLVQACSGCGDLYVSGFLGNVFFGFTILTIAYYVFIKKILSLLNPRIKTFIFWFLTILYTAIISFNLYVYEWGINWTHDMKVYCVETPCEQKIIFFNEFKGNGSVY
jgi:hypothetical protein